MDTDISKAAHEDMRLMEIKYLYCKGGEYVRMNVVFHLHSLFLDPAEGELSQCWDTLRLTKDQRKIQRLR
jgi:hypothetical protein